ncbi:MAG: 3-hydroxyacyl-CoA dehydrogenase [Rhodobacteraceae bacterium]|nr:3-hydroxyacyl-CoA dehydrogenase [Paracoccaceae bacterium]
MKNANAADFVVGVVGAGAMGQGIAQVSAQGGMRTLLLDARPGAAAAAKNAVTARLARLVEKGRLSRDECEAASDRIEPVDGASALSTCDTVVEAVFEDLEVKRALFREIEAVVTPDCLIASNTSSIPIAAIAQACEKRDRVAGLHFFNPVPVMKLVEVIRAAESSDASVEALTVLGRRFGRTPVVVKDSPGFLVNLGGRAFTTEGLRITHENVAPPEVIDAVMRDCRHFRMGPFELMDLTGIDVNFPVSQIVYDGYMQDPRLKTSPNHRAMMEAGLWGRKTGAGWYRYDKGAPLERPSPDYQTEAAPALEVFVAEVEGGMNAELREFCAEIGLRVVFGASESAPETPILAAPIGDDATQAALAAGADPRRLVCLDLCGDISSRVTLMTAPGADLACRDMVAAAVAASGRKISVISDSPGFVGQRMAAMVANLGCYMAEIGLAAPEDVDTAMTLGLNYPLGPLALAEDIGMRRCLRILERLHAITGEDRYRPSLWLKRRALLDLAAHTPS